MRCRSSPANRSARDFDVTDDVPSMRVFESSRKSVKGSSLRTTAVSFIAISSPTNILLDPHAVIADFGIAKAMFDATHGGTARIDEIRTATGVGLGTPAYMSPEQAAGVRSIDHRADLYALGVIAYEMLTGEAPFGGSRQSIVTAHLAKQPERPSSRRAEVPASLDALVMRLLEKNAGDRPGSAFEVLSALAR